MKKIVMGLCCALALVAVRAEAQAGPDAGVSPMDAGVAGAAPPVTAPVTAPITQPSPPPAAEERETVCTGRADEDHDGLVDCGDADCFQDPACESGQGTENNDASCSDWIDNDGDSVIDCDDDDCAGPGVTRCRGSWGAANPGGNNGVETADQVEITDGTQPEDLIGTRGDVDGERSDETCADGIDNDHDSRTDCEDFGCRFNPDVSACVDSGGFRFSPVVGAGIQWMSSRQGGTAASESALDASFDRISLRVFGPMPLIQNSFFLLSIRAERQVRLTWAMFQMPLGGNHYLNLNSGSGGLSTSLVQSAYAQLLLEPAYYTYNAFELGNGAALELGGPITSDGMLHYRLFAAGGSGRFNGNVGGRFFSGDDTNFTYGAGGQIHVNLVGSYDRFDTPFLYTPARTTVALLAGAKFDQRSDEQFVAANTFAVFRHGRFFASAEAYGKRELAFGAFQLGYVVQGAVLVIPKWLLLSADFGMFRATDFTDATAAATAGLDRPLSEDQFRAAAHLYVYRNIVRTTLLYTHHTFEFNPDRPQDVVTEDTLRLEAMFRF